MKNIVRESRIISAFQIYKVCAPLILVLPAKFVRSELLQVHIECEENRSFEMLLEATSRTEMDSTFLSAEIEILDFYESSKKNEDN